MKDWFFALSESNEILRRTDTYDTTKVNDGFIVFGESNEILRQTDTYETLTSLLPM